MTYEEALGFIHGVNNFQRAPGLERMKRLCELLENPQDSLRAIHVAGTNGKGSVVTMISCALEAAGYTVGKYTSPFVYDFRERIELNGKMIEKDELARLTSTVARACEAMEEQPTEFETVTAIAFLYFKEKNCDFAVLETGLGGRFDATNVIKAPLLSVICSISLDHTEILGSTEDRIAHEKAGIIKPGCPCVLYPLNSESVTGILKDTCNRHSSAVLMPELSRLSVKSSVNNRLVFEYRGVRYCPRLLGKHQIYNALTAICALEALGVENSYISDGVANAALHGRYEVFSEKPRVILDVGHNRGGIECLVRSLKNDKKIKNLTVIFGMCRDKDYPYAIRELASIANSFICIAPDSPRALPPETVKEIAELFCTQCIACDSAEQAVSEALFGLRSGTLLVCGSFYIMDGVVRELKRQFENL